MRTEGPKAQENGNSGGVCKATKRQPFSRSWFNSDKNNQPSGWFSLSRWLVAVVYGISLI